MKQHISKVLYNRRLAPAYYKIGLTCTRSYTDARAGQFVMLRLPGQTACLLRRPFSIHNLIIEDGTVRGLEVLFKVVGTATAALAEQKIGNEIDLFGPLGNGFTIPTRSERVYVAGGGIGVAPLVFLISELHRQQVGLSAYRVFIGGRSKADLLCIEDFRRCGLTVLATTDDGSAGDRCLVTDPLEMAVRKQPPDLIVACGPTAMLACVVGIAENHRVPCQVSIEAMMACGMGACLGCAVENRSESGRYFHACVDGPVFAADALKF